MRKAGFTLVEVLIALALLVTVLAVALRYFTATAETGRLTQAKGELQDRVRMVMQVVSGDLQLAGAKYWTWGTQSVGFTLVGTLEGTDGGAKDTLTVRYVTSLREQSAACRRVDYTFSGDTLQRSDVNITPASGAECATGTPSPTPLADGILALDIQYLCSDGSAKNVPDCGASAYPRSARLTVAGYSLTPVRGGGGSLTTVSGQSLTCPANRLCYAMTQEVLMPNLKPVQ
ncbi:prepilin-type N-terminal cleavage/methylation domain-containing protein [Thermus oshimai JL-2]|uniref:Prepilin-type N-terminal cleavage/methylation domain-containing protein n=1 Tax=Thermus oshimai JL-2 TaxID=751945 RepID=K7R5U3_THEOS|nr:prepilin-type N-terminal cleavage/methylation domain-containing protein [Thermus oshimai]AFV76279.1 prepilin-type N-terminal cleavage/methylation domain-containing protein [Thermus oshimai JL-2]